MRWQTTGRPRRTRQVSCQWCTYATHPPVAMLLTSLFSLSRVLEAVHQRLVERLALPPPRLCNSRAVLSPCRFTGTAGWSGSTSGWWSALPLERWWWTPWRALAPLPSLPPPRAAWCVRGGAGLGRGQHNGRGWRGRSALCATIWERRGRQHSCYTYVRLALLPMVAPPPPDCRSTLTI